MRHIPSQHQYLQTETKRQSNRRDATARTTSELLLWWKNIGVFSLKNEKTSIDMIIALHHEWKNLNKTKNLQNEFQEKERVAFLRHCEKPFWVATAQREEKAQTILILQ